MGNNPGNVPGNNNIKQSSGTPNLSFDIKNNVLFKRNDENIIYYAGSTQIPAMAGGSVADLHLSKGYIREPHWHPNAWELDILVSGHAEIGILDPDTHQLHIYELTKPGDIVFIPMGWMHWITGKSDNTELHLFLNNGILEGAEMSDVLRLTPPGVFQLAYGVNAEELEEVLSPITETVIIGPVNSSIGKHLHHKDHSDKRKPLK